MLFQTLHITVGSECVLSSSMHHSSNNDNIEVTTEFTKYIFFSEIFGISDFVKVVACAQM